MAITDSTQSRSRATAKTRKKSSVGRAQSRSTTKKKRGSQSTGKQSATVKVPKRFKHQTQTIKLARKLEYLFDLSDPGTGKTRSALEIWVERNPGKLLVLAPKSLLEPAWGEDINRFIPGTSYSVAYAENRIEAFQTDADIYITNIDAVRWLAKQPASFFKPFGMIIVDELSHFKHRNSKRSKALISIAKHFKYRHGMDGTPTSTSITDIWNQIRFLDDGRSLGKSFIQFRNAVCTPKQVGPSIRMVKWIDKPHSEQAVFDLIKEFSIRHSLEKCLDLPKNHEYSRMFTLSNKTFGKYLEMENNARVELGDVEINAVNSAVLRNKLLQIASGAVYENVSDDRSRYQLIDTGRYEFLADLVEERRHSIVFYNWRHQKDQLALELDRRGITFEFIDSTVPSKRRNQIIQAYQAGFYQSLLLHPLTGAHGLTLTRGTATIWASPIYQWSLAKQGLHRIYRAGQTERTETIYVRAKNTVERLVYEDVMIPRRKQSVSFLQLIERTVEERCSN